ncbi:hypothetical protein B296_00000362 [Ensete ventricosum]|uniref:Uncharacterized protein n=1 Tax=Ensete ventricosum TaxID=4639 RepID=A0A427B6U9_ENSVE|nr:hypothetical protein B296_00000362 [Ensete ventricosum]
MILQRRDFVESSIPFSHGGRALVVKEAEKVKNAEANSKYQDKAEGQRPRNFVRLVNQQGSTQLSGPHIRVGHWRVEVACRIKVRLLERRASGSQDACCNWSRRLKIQQKVFELGVVTKPGAEGREADGDVVVWNKEATVPEHLQQGTPSQKVSVTLNSSRVNERDQALWHHIRFHRFHLRLFFPSFVCPALALALAFAFGVDDTGINRGKDKRKRGKRARECSECHLRLCSPSIPNPPKVVHF